MNPVLSWPGSKRLLAKTIVPLFVDHKLYCEPFCGSAAILMAKDRSKNEVVNDLNGDLINFFKMVKYHGEALAEEIRGMPNSRRLFCELLKHPGETELQRAARWYYLNKNSFAGLGGHFGTSRHGGGASFGKQSRRAEAVRALQERFDGVCIENLGWEAMFEKYDASGNLFYIDPPYTSGYQYGHKWSKADHTQLAEAVHGLQASFVLSYDESDLIRDLYADCELMSVERRNGIGNNHQHHKKRFAELIIRRTQ